VTAQRLEKRLKAAADQAAQGGTVNSGHARLAARLLGAGETLRTGIGASVMPVVIPLLAQAQASVIAALGPLKFEVEFKAGKHLTRADAIELALGTTPHGAAASSDGAGTGLLGTREVEVARLVAGGLSNKQIGARLSISERTAESHVRSILNKLGFHSRAQIAGWMTSQ